MELRVNTIDSLALGKTVLDLSDLAENDDLAAIEREYVAEHKPAYVAALADVRDLGAIHLLEKHGFFFMESQIKMSCHITNRCNTEGFHYRFEVVESEEDLAPILDIASSAFSQDRFSVDPLIPPGVSAKRYRLYIMKSFAADDERVYRLVHETTGETVAFRTHRIRDNREALLLLGAVKPEYENSPMTRISEFFEINALREQGIRHIYTHISSRQSPLANLEIKGIGFRVEGAAVLLRKWYGQG